MSKFLDTFQGKKFASPPLWFMRQAGRYLPEYKEIRQSCNTFLDLCYNPEKAAKVTLQPIERFELDAAILFSDILVIPHALGQSVSFKEGVGPQLNDVGYGEDLDGTHFTKTLTPIYHTIRLVKEQLPETIPLIGFVGAPWTLALYMLEGGGSRDFARAKERAFSDNDRFSKLLNLLTDALSYHVEAQVGAGVDAIQIFDTWAGLCPATHFEKWVLGPIRNVVSNLRDTHPDLPIIGFPKGVGTQMKEYGEKADFSALSLDSSISLPWAVKEIPRHVVLQGNLDPVLLVAGGEPLYQAILSIHEQMKDRPYIFNLGHGILPQTPIKNVEDCVKWVRELESKKQLSSCSI